MKNKPYFIQRFVAFIIDVLLVSFLASLIASPFLDSKSISKLEESTSEISQQFVKGEINTMEYLSENAPISYELARKSGLVSIILVFLYILYFIVFQFYSKGQTIGKKLVKIRVENIDGELTMNNLVFRSLLINSILYRMISLCLMVFGNSTIYFYGSISFELIQYTLLAVCGFMVMFGKSGRGLHDFLGHTQVVRTNLVEEKELCEN